MNRPVETAITRGADIDSEKEIWTIPAERMKLHRARIVPLTEQATILKNALNMVGTRIT